MRRWALLTLLCACGQNAVQAELKGETTVGGDPRQPPLASFPTVGALTNIDVKNHPDLEAAGLDARDIRSVRVERAKVRILSPPDGNFSWLDTLTFVAKAGDVETPVAERTGIAALELPGPNPTLQLDIKDHELRPLLDAPSFSIIGRTKGKHPVTDVRLDVTVGLRIEAAIF